MKKRKLVKNKMKILILGPYAPHGQVGAQRIISLSRYLIEKKHSVSVLCLSEKTLKEIDKNGLTASIPKGVKIISYDISTSCKSLMKKNYVNGSECRRALIDELNKESYDVIFVSAGPFYTFNAIAEAKKRKIPYIVDYRDLHISSPDKRKRTGLINKIKFAISFPARFLQEYICLKNSSKITVVSPEMKENICNYFKISKEKVHVIYNGYDDYALKGISKEAPLKDEFCIGYFGKLMYYNKQFTALMFNAIEKLNGLGYNIKLLHVGPTNKEINSYFRTNNMNAMKWYKCVGQKEYAEGIEILSSCNAFYLEYEMPEGPGTKVFDYIYLNKPIIGVLRPNISLEKLLKEFDNAFVCYNETQVENAILKIINEKINTLTNGKKDSIIKYSRSIQNNKLEKLLRTVKYGK